MTPNSTPSRLSVVIPNWNGAHHLPVCLDALRRHDERESMIEQAMARRTKSSGATQAAGDVPEENAV